MDFTPELSALQGIIISADNVHSFSTLTTRGGNEEEIQYVINSITSFLKKEKYINENAVAEDKEATLRKFALYIVLNADIPVLEEMVDMEGIHMAIWTIPTISKCLLSEMLWNFHMEKFVYEIIAFCSPLLALEVSSALIDNIKYFTPYTCLPKIKLISAACYRLISRLHFFNLENKIISNILTSAYNNFQQCLNYFISPPNAGKLDTISKDELYKYRGNCLHTILNLIFECLQQYTAVQEFTPVDFDEMYLLTCSVDILATDRSSSPNRCQDILESLDKCHLMLLDKCKELVMDVSVDVYCAWSEFEENGQTMQQTVGELCYKLRKKLLTINSISEHPLIDMIQQISSKPVSFEEIINVTDSQTITEYINANNNRTAWVRALLLRHNLCHDVTLIEHLASNLEVFNREECYTLYKVCQDYLKDSTENANEVELLAAKLFQYCNNDTKYEILEQRFSENYFIDMAETNDFNNMMTEIFNKFISSPDSNLSDVLNVFIQSPQKVYMKIFLLAAENGQQTEIMLRIMKLLEKYSNHYYSHDTEPCIMGVIKKLLETHLDTETKQLNFVKFLSSLKTTGIITGAQLLLLIIMPKLHKALVNNDICSINIQCRLISAAYTLDELLQYRAPMLAMLAQVLEVVRWKLDTFVVLGPNTLSLVLQLQTSIFITYDAEIPDKEANWLRSKLKNVQPMNLYYYRKLWNLSHNFVEAVSGVPITKETDVTQLAAWLSLITCSSTQEEWCNIWDNLGLFGDSVTLDILHKILTQVTETQARNHTDKTWACLLNCYKNFVFTIRYKFFKEPLTDGQISTVIMKIAALANLVDEGNVEDIGTVLLPLFAYMAERKNDYTMNVLHSLHAFKHSKVRDLVNKIFMTNGAV